MTKARKAERDDRHATQAPLGRITEVPKISPRNAAFFRKIGTYIDSAQVQGKDDGFLSLEDADLLRESGVLVLDSEIDPIEAQIRASNKDVN